MVPMPYRRFLALGLFVSFWGIVCGETPIQFHDVTKEAEIHWRHQNGKTEEKFLIETMGKWSAPHADSLREWGTFRWPNCLPSASRSMDMPTLESAVDIRHFLDLCRTDLRGSTVTFQGRDVTVERIVPRHWGQ